MPGRMVGELSKLTLGTVQLGLPYGKIVSSSPADQATASRIFDMAFAGGIRCLDTAGNYGSAEQLIGGWLEGHSDRPLIVSKLPAYPTDSAPDPTKFVTESIARSLADLGIDCLDAYLLHRPSDIHVEGLVDAVSRAVGTGHAKAWGVSVYTDKEFRSALDLPDLSVIQAPVSVFDTRLMQSGMLDKAAQGSVTVFARSIFLQGAAFIDPNNVPAPLQGLEQALRRLHVISAESGFPVGAIALQAVMSLNTVSSAVIGVMNEAQLEQAITWSRTDISGEILREVLKIGEDVDPAVVDPRRWPQTVS